MSAIIPNPTRGELVVTLAGTDHLLRPTFAAISVVETMTGLGLVGVARRLLNNDYGVRDVAFTIRAGLVGAGSSLPIADVEDLVFASGVLNVAPVAKRFVTLALNGGKDDPEGATPRSGEAAAVETETGSPSAA